MRAAVRLLQQRQPMIKFIGRRHTPPAKIDHTPAPHPASPKDSLPDSFASYRQKAQQHGPLKGQAPATGSGHHLGDIGSHSGHSLGPVEPHTGEFFDRSELPARFKRAPWTQSEIDAIESGGASTVG